MTHDEYQCCECGVHVWLAAGTIPEPPLCGKCLYIPGWHESFVMRAVFDGAPWGAAWPFEWNDAPVHIGVDLGSGPG